MPQPTRARLHAEKTARMKADSTRLTQEKSIRKGRVIVQNRRGHDGAFQASGMVMRSVSRAMNGVRGSFVMCPMPPGGRDFPNAYYPGRCGFHAVDNGFSPAMRRVWAKAGAAF